MPEQQTEVQIDLRDEVQYLRELVESLLGELKAERQRQVDFPTSYYPPIVVLPAPPPQIIERHYPPQWDWTPHTTWATTTTNALGEGSCNQIIWKANIEDDDNLSGAVIR